ncbi:MAG: GH3 auxin-responsive promoter family protein [Dehalococcoidia bacterium]|nr:MAG: GH3 auxin-responsive promoter family protein [Dehalococcoidia bacterium]
MTVEAELFQQGKYEQLWQRCCGFIDLGIDDFMRIQKRLLLEQIQALAKCTLGQKIMGDIIPESLEAFREEVPLTTYKDYAPYLIKRRMDVMPKKPILWQCTSGKSGVYPYLWAPVTAQQLDTMEPYMFALLILSTCKKKGEINLRGGERCFYGMAPPPYATGTMTRVFPYELFNSLPSIEESEVLTFEERLKKGFELALDKGLDMTIAMSSVAVAIGERFGKQGQNGTGMKKLLCKPKTMLRLIKGLVKSKLARRQLMPKDLWTIKGLVTFGMDGSVYKEKIKQMWGKYALDFHGCTEAPFIAIQTWDFKGMTFVPNLNFYEFIPEAEIERSVDDPLYQPKTLLMDELTPGNYELVITSFHGGPFIRYRLGHLVRILSVRNEKLNIDIPQMEFIARVDDQIDIAGFTRLSEKIIWKAIENTGLPYKDWVVRKEVGDKPLLHFYIETKDNGHIENEQISQMVHQELKKLDKPYEEMEAFTGLKPIKVTLLPEDAFETYKNKQRANGANLVHLKPPHLNPSEDILEILLAARTEEVSILQNADRT